MSNRTGVYEVFVMPSGGGPQTQLSHTGKAEEAGEPRWSPDGTKIAFQEQVNSHYEIFVIGANGTGLKQLTNVAYDNTDPAWSPDGKKIAFLSQRDNGTNVYVMNADGSDQKKIA